jgi:hypothetical protein
MLVGAEQVRVELTHPPCESLQTAETHKSLSVFAGQTIGSVAHSPFAGSQKLLKHGVLGLQVFVLSTH